MNVLECARRALESLSLKQCCIEMDCGTCLVSNPPTTLRHLDMQGTVVRDVPPEDAPAPRSTHLPPVFFADLPLHAPDLETLVLPPMRYQLPTVSLPSVLYFY